MFRRTDVAGVEMITAVVGVIGSIVVALLARIPGLSRDDRQRARILRDAELLRAMPDDSPARDPLAEHIADSTHALMEERKADRALWRLWGAGLWCAFAGWVLLLAFSAIRWDPFEEFWEAQVRVALFYVTIGAGLLAVIFWALAIWVGAPRAWRWVRDRVRR